tara:strand:- start:1651 stop:2346 length:696 start_codon:yes stop_codon:yes gene_type:complete
MDHTFQEHFKYTHRNPYHDKLTEFGDFLLRDEDSELNRGQWNEKVFGREGSLCAEIGSGYGHFMMDYCENNPSVNFVGMDFRFKRTFYLAKKLAAHPTKNFRYLRARGERLKFIFGESEVDHMFYFFPDPWPKKRHHKKRLFQQPFIEAAHHVMKPGATLWIKTDHDGYAEWMQEFMNKPEAQALFDCKMHTQDLHAEQSEHFLASFKTKFEKIFLAQGTKIKAFELVSKK